MVRTPNYRCKRLRQPLYRHFPHRDNETTLSIIECGETPVGPYVLLRDAVVTSRDAEELHRMGCILLDAYHWLLDTALEKKAKELKKEQRNQRKTKARSNQKGKHES